MGVLLNLFYPDLFYCYKAKEETSTFPRVCLNAEDKEGESMIRRLSFSAAQLEDSQSRRICALILKLLMGMDEKPGP